MPFCIDSNNFMLPTHRRSQKHIVHMNLLVSHFHQICPQNCSLSLKCVLKKHASMVIWFLGHLFWVTISYLIGGIIRNLSAYCGMIKSHRHCCWDTLFHTLQKQPFSIVQQFFECDFWKITLTSKSDQYLGPEITWDLENS